jgi:hypothetical protein
MKNFSYASFPWETQTLRPAVVGAAEMKRPEGYPAGRCRKAKAIAEPQSKVGGNENSRRIDVDNSANVVAVGISRSAIGALLTIVLAITIITDESPTFAQTKPYEVAVIPPNKDTDLKFYQSDGKIQQGVAALERMTSDADLVLWLAGNQFFAMDEVIGAFQKKHPGVTVGLITLPPGLILSAIQGSGWIYNGKSIAALPTSMPPSILDIYNN